MNFGMTATELKKVLDNHIDALPVVTGSDFIIHLSNENYLKAKYSCTEDEKDFKYIKGAVLYKGFELKTLPR